MYKREGACNYFRVSIVIWTLSPYNGFQGRSVHMTNKKFNEEFKKMVVKLYRSG